ncbi:uncharacterized protein [Centruroides vittatus]|uniref:uncharacterized protein n=1 Tax=Centruroides vittatus TaxID=120091 RepID=UPI00350EC9EE
MEMDRARTAMRTSILGVVGMARGIDNENESRNELLLLARADDIVVIGASREEVTTLTSKLATAAKNLGLILNEEKTKYVVISKKKEFRNEYLTVDNLTFGSTEFFVYLGTDINGNNNCNIQWRAVIGSGGSAASTFQ